MKLRTVFSVPVPAGQSNRWASSLVALAIGVGVLASSTRADEVADANVPYKAIKESLRSDLALLPKLAKLTPPPKGIATVEDSAIVSTSASNWADLAAWAQGAPQVEVLTALKQVTQERDWRKASAFGQPYGIDGVAIDLIRAKLYTEVGDPPTLAAAKFMYLSALDSLQKLVNVEATRLVTEKKASEAIDLLLNFVYFGRQMVDRQFAKESKWGYEAMMQGYERIRDVAYTDIHSNNPPSITQDQILAALDRLDESDAVKGYLDLTRAKLPMGDRLAAKQIGAMIYDAGGAINNRTFSTTMARLGSTDRPLRLFSEAGRWASSASSQPARMVYDSKVKGAYEDWNHRWILDFFDKQNSLPTAYAENKAGAGVMSAVVPDLSDTFDLRQLTKVEAAGTRTALGVVGAWLSRKEWPPVVTGIRPRFIKELDVDPYNPNRDHGARPPLEYFVPNRAVNAGAGRTTTAEPHEVDVVPRTGGQKFTVRLRDDVFVLYSVGPDGGPNLAKRVQNGARLSDNKADYLLWPPTISLRRQYLDDSKISK